jgi:diaminopimelate decarboxylase
VVTGGPKSKFGIYWYEIPEAIKIAKENDITIFGIHQHIGSNLKKKDENIFIDTVEYIFKKSKEFPDLKHINIGGGIGIQYKESETLMDIQSLYDRVRKIRDQYNEET